MNELPDKISLTCPHCQHVCAKVPLMSAATTVHRRTCRYCHVTWTITLKPKTMVPGKAVSVLEKWVPSRLRT